jgi:hypothetical protein
MRNISFALTTEQVRAQTKDVTRRLGWRTLKPKTPLRAVVKCMGLKPGETVEPLALITVKSVRLERLDAITPEDVVREGFPGMTPAEFVAMFCKHMKCEPSREVTRIEFGYASPAINLKGVR